MFGDDSAVRVICFGLFFFLESLLSVADMLVLCLAGTAVREDAVILDTSLSIITPADNQAGAIQPIR